jgi:hypothetical protein
LRGWSSREAAISSRRGARHELYFAARVEEGNEPAISPRLRKLLDEAWQEKLEPLCARGFSSFDKVLIEFGECMYPML